MIYLLPAKEVPLLFPLPIVPHEKYVSNLNSISLNENEFNEKGQLNQRLTINESGDNNKLIMFFLSLLLNSRMASSHFQNGTVRRTKVVH